MAVDSAAPGPASSSAPQRLFRITTPTRTDRRIKALFYGVPGAGKTTLAASAADLASMCDVLFLDAESGDMSISEREDIDVVPITSFAQFARVHEFLRLHCRYRDAKDTENLRRTEAKVLDPELIRSKPRMYRTVVIDSLTEVQRYLMNRIVGVEIGKTALDADFQTPEGKDWQQQSEAIKHLVRSFRDLPMNVIFVCAEQEFENDKKQRLKRPSLPGKLALEVLGFMDIVGYLAEAGTDDKGEMQRRLWLQPQPTFPAKSRLQSLKVPFLENPTMSSLIATDHGPVTDSSRTPANGTAKTGA